MGARTQVQTVVTTVDPLSVHSRVEVLSGNTVQTYNTDTQEYEPDRALVPLVLMPYVEASDPDGLQDGRQALTAVEWYEGVPAGDFSNRITAGTDYDIGDGTATGFPKGALKVKKNVPADTPVQVFCVAKFTDARTQTTVRLEMSASLYTMVYESKSYTVRLDCPSSWKINPAAETTWQHTLTAQLYGGAEAVGEGNAAYWWEVMSDGDADWHAPTDEDEELWLACRDGDGVFTRTLTFDARMFKTARFRVRAAYYDGDRPQSAAEDGLRAETLVNVELPPSLKVDLLQVKGFRSAPDFSTPTGYKVLAYDNRGVMSDGQVDAMLRIEWKGRSAKAGSQDVFLGSGREVEFVPKDKGFDPSYPVGVWADVKFYDRHKAVTDGDGRLVTDGEGRIVIAPEYE